MRFASISNKRVTLHSKPSIHYQQDVFLFLRLTILRNICKKMSFEFIAIVNLYKENETDQCNIERIIDI